MIGILLSIIGLALQVYIWVIIVTVVLSWLIALNIVNAYRPEVRAVQRVCWQLTEPLLQPIRRRLPDMGGLDISPIVLLLGVNVLQILLDKVGRGDF